jgi:uncharacterized protein (TIGR00661 family)
MHVFIGICCEGFGHASRAIALHRALLERGHDVTIGCYGNVLRELRKQKIRVQHIYPEINMLGQNGRFDLISSSFKTIVNSPNVLRSKLAEQKLMERHSVDFVIADSRLATVLAALSTRRPVFYITNQNFYPSSSLTMRMLSELLAVPGRLCDRVLVPDFEPPNTLCLPLISREFELKKKTYFVGPISKALWNQKPAAWNSKRPKVLVSIGGQQFRRGVFQRMVVLASKMRDYNFMFFSMFVKRKRRMKNVSLSPFSEGILSYMASSDMVVVSAGHSGLMEAVLLEKPMIAVPDAEQPEQESNARRVEELKLGLSLRLSELHRLEEKLGELEAGYRKVKRRQRVFAKQAKTGQNGAENTVKMMENFIERMTW